VADFVKKVADFKNNENQNYNFAGKKEGCVTWHLREKEVH
jgi:hypothetical protein